MLRGLRALHPFADFVVVAAHAELLIDLLGAGVAFLHVETQAADVMARFGQGLYMVEELLEDTATASFRDHINALDPPDIAVAPIAPLVGDEQGAEDAIAFKCDVIAAMLRLLENGEDTRSALQRIEAQLLRLPRHGELKIGDGGGVRQDRFATMDG